MCETFTLYNGIEIPSIGFGTDRTFIFLRKNIIAGFNDMFKDIMGNKYYYKRDKSLYKIVKLAPKVGCYLFDTASSYGQSEFILGKALKKYNREDYFIITKLSNKEQLTKNVEKALKRSLRKMNIDYVDLYLMHWPQTQTYIQCWKQMEEIYDKGLARAIGVCNFKEHHFEKLMKVARIKPMVCQVESHPLFPQNDILQYCINNNIQMMAYTPTGRMDKRISENEEVKKIASKHKKSVAQIILRWHFQRNVIPIINTTNIYHLKENILIYDFKLTNLEMKIIDSLNQNLRLRYDPDTVDFNKC